MAYHSSKWSDRMKKSILFLIFLSSKIFAGPYEIIIETPKESIKGSHIKEATIGLDRLTTDGADDQDVLYFDGLDWMPAPLTGLTFRGAWNPNQNSPEILEETYEHNSVQIPAISGDYFIVTESMPDLSWNKGDWIVFNGSNWERINNTGAVLSVFTRKGVVRSRIGDYRWDQIDKTGSSIFDLSNITKPNAPLSDYEGFTFKWNKTTKKFELKEDNMGIAAPVSSDAILDGTISDNDISPNAKIQLSKIEGFNGGTGKLKFTGGIVKDLKLDSQHNLVAGDSGKVVIRDSSGNEETIVLSELKKKFDDVVNLFVNKESKFSGTNNPQDFLTGKKDSNGNRVWSIFNLDVSDEGTINKFQTDKNVWEAKLNNYNIENAPTPLVSVNGEDTLMEGIQKLEAYFNNGLNNIIVHTPQIDNFAVDFKKHFYKESENSGFLYLGGEEPKSWSIKMTSGLQFKGDKSLTDFPLPTPALSGDYYVINDNGENNGVNWHKGDWAIYDGTQYLQIDNTGKVLEFNGRRDIVITCPDIVGCKDSYDYSWKMLDLTNSKLQDISDVNAPTSFDAPNGNDKSILKFINGKWKLDLDNSGVVAGSSISASSIQDGTIKDIHVGNYILIDQIQNLRTGLDNLLNKTGGNMSGDIDLGDHNLLGINKIDNNDFAKVIDYATNYQKYIDEKEDKISGNSGDVLTVVNSTKNQTALNTMNLIEGSTNLYFTEQRVYDSKGATNSTGNYDSSTNKINYNGSNSDSLKTAIEKLNSQISSAGDLPENSVDGDAIKNGTITIDKLSDADQEGQTVLFRGGEWIYSSISGLNSKGTWGINDQTTADNANDYANLSPGDYFIINSDGKIDGEDYLSGDWAVYNIDGGFNKISNSQYMTSFNNRVGAIVKKSNDYEWSLVVTGSDVTKEKISSFEDVDDSLVASDEILVWDQAGVKWKTAPDKAGLSGVLQITDFSTGQNGQPKAVTNVDIHDISFSAIKDLQTEFDTYFVKIDSDPVNFHGNLMFDTSSDYNITGIKQIIDPDDTNNKFSPINLKNECDSLNPNLFEPKYSKEDNASPSKKMFLNGNKEFVTIKPENIAGTLSNRMYDPKNIQEMSITGFSYASSDFSFSPRDENADGFNSEDPNSNGWGTKFIDVFKKLAGKVKSFSAHESAGTAGNDDLNTVDDTNSLNGMTLFLGNRNFNFNDIDTLTDGFEITIKREDGNIPANVEIIPFTNQKINNKSKITLAENFSSVTIKKIKQPNNPAEFIILRKYGTVY